MPPKQANPTSITSHTPTPWHVGTREPDSDQHHIISGGQYICGIDSYSGAKEDAAFIVRAVNAYDALLDACKMAFSFQHLYHSSYTHTQVYNQLEKAIALAEEVTK